MSIGREPEADRASVRKGLCCESAGGVRGGAEVLAVGMEGVPCARDMFIEQINGFAAMISCVP